MPDKYLYLATDILCVLFPLLCSFHRRIPFYKQWRWFALPCLATALLFLVWDVVFTRLGVWGFNPRYLLGIYVAGLPLEELLFFLCIPYACVFTYYAISVLVRVRPPQRSTRGFTLALAAVLAVVAVLHIRQLYTSVTFLLLAAVLLVLALRRAAFMGAFYMAFLITIIPFYISNGVLTGSFTPEPVVSYNNAYNLGIRTLTIPIEDIFYGMALLLLNVAGMEWMKKGIGDKLISDK